METRKMHKTGTELLHHFHIPASSRKGNLHGNLEHHYAIKYIGKVHKNGIKYADVVAKQSGILTVATAARI